MTINTLLWVGLGGALGAMARFSLATAIFKWIGKAYPYGTLSVNLIGSFAIGMAYIWLVENELGGDASRHFIMIGFLGAFTTFSTFSLESLTLLQQGRMTAFLTYIALSLIGCMLATALGMILTKQLV
ncbi:CrcB protein homolog, putative [Oleispira antarctica RB-8]|uniref:Fluoride-specific ion channel FluC n=1 Tax=Oleispira antarctica RB-8 TaxID=698738 RepID=R4YTT1_OLEAN|nr:CrcB protein homolog, putative [Oleispira antarctica RB-8]